MHPLGSERAPSDHQAGHAVDEVSFNSRGLKRASYRKCDRGACTRDQYARACGRAQWRIAVSWNDGSTSGIVDMMALGMSGRTSDTPIS